MIEFEPLRREHLALLRDWLDREHVRRWWRDGDKSLEHAGDALDGRDPTKYFLIVLEGRPIGMIETYLVADNLDWGRRSARAKARPGWISSSARRT